MDEDKKEGGSSSATAGDDAAATSPQTAPALDKRKRRELLVFLAGATPLEVLGRKTRESLGTICKKLGLSIYGRYDPTTHPNSAAAAKRSVRRLRAVELAETLVATGLSLEDILWGRGLEPPRVARRDPHGPENKRVRQQDEG